MSLNLSHHLGELMRLADDIREARIAPMSDEENVAEVKAHRAERRACQS